jgi:group I intron endonuclease
VAKKLTGIYKVLSPTGKVYIGQSRDIKKRFYQYHMKYCINQSILFKSLKKHGPENHVFSIVHELPFDVTQEVLDTLEILYISQYKAVKVLMLNSKEGGYKGKHSVEARKRMSETRKLKRKVTKGFTGRKHTEESKQAIRDKMKARVFTEEHKRNISKGSIGKKMSPEAIAKGIESRKSYVPTEVTRQKHRDRMLNYKHSPETKRKISEANKGKKKTPEAIAKRLASLKRNQELKKLNKHNAL